MAQQSLRPRSHNPSLQCSGPISRAVPDKAKADEHLSSCTVLFPRARPLLLPSSLLMGIPCLSLPMQEYQPPSKCPPLSLRPLGCRPRARRFTVVRPHHPRFLLPFRSLLNAVTANCCPHSCQLITDRQSDLMSTLSLPFAGLTVTMDATDPAILPQTLSSPCLLVP